MPKQPPESIHASTAACRIGADPRVVTAAAERGELPSNTTELIEELDATEERYVRKKLALRGYCDWQKPVAQHWLDDRAAMRQETQNRWVRIGVYAASSSVFITVAWKLLQIT